MSTKKTKTKKQKLSEALAKESLEDLRFRRNLASRDGDFKLAFACAVAIDRKKGYY